MPSTLGLTHSISNKQSKKTYDQWLAEEVQAAIDDPREGIPHEKVMAQMAQLIKDLTHAKQ